MNEFAVQTCGENWGFGWLEAPCLPVLAVEDIEIGRSPNLESPMRHPRRVRCCLGWITCGGDERVEWMYAATLNQQ